MRPYKLRSVVFSMRAGRPTARNPAGSSVKPESTNPFDVEVGQTIYSSMSSLAECALTCLLKMLEYGLEANIWMAPVRMEVRRPKQIIVQTSKISTG